MDLSRSRFYPCVSRTPDLSDLGLCQNGHQCDKRQQGYLEEKAPTTPGVVHELLAFETSGTMTMFRRGRSSDTGLGDYQVAPVVRYHKVIR